METDVGVKDILPEPETPQSTARSTQTPRFEECDTNDTDFPLTKSFIKLDAKEKERIFLKLFEEKLAATRTKELKCSNSPVLDAASEADVAKVRQLRDQAFENACAQECKSQLMQRTTKNLDVLPRNVEDGFVPTFDPLLNTNFNSQFALLDKFKACVSAIIVENRAKTRARQISDFFRSNTQSKQTKYAQSRPPSESSLSSLLSLKIEIVNNQTKIASPQELPKLPYPDVTIDPHAIERKFGFYEPSIIEKFALTPFSRTEVNSFIKIPIKPPDRFPIVREEQPIIEHVSASVDSATPESLSGKSSSRSMKSRTQSMSNLLPFVPQQAKIIQYPREIKFFDFDPISELRTEKTELPDLDIEIGRSSILSLPAADYQPMMLTGKFKKISPFQFAGIPDAFSNFNCLPPMSSSNPVDTRELEFDDDIDNIDVSQKAKPITDFLTKPVETKNKSHIISEAMVEGQSKWRERQRKEVQLLNEHLTVINELLHDKTLSVSTADLKTYLMQ